LICMKNSPSSYSNQAIFIIANFFLLVKSIGDFVLPT